MEKLRFFQEEQGATAIEYGLIASLIFLVILVSVSNVGTNTAAMWTNISTHI